MAKRVKEALLHGKIKVMNVLEQDSNKNIDIIAKECGSSRQKVWRIIKDLERRNIILGLHCCD